MLPVKGNTGFVHPVLALFHTDVTNRIRRADSLVDTILVLRRYAQIALAAIQWIAVYVVYNENIILNS